MRGILSIVYALMCLYSYSVLGRFYVYNFRFSLQFRYYFYGYLACYDPCDQVQNHSYPALIHNTNEPLLGVSLNS